MVLLPLLMVFAGAGLAAVAWLVPRRPWPILRVAAGLALAPLAAFVTLLRLTPAVIRGESLVWRMDWVPDLHLAFSLSLDGLSLLFALIISGIGVLVLVYAGYYFKGESDNHARFLTWLLLFMGCMLGVVLAGDVITLFVFWEGTSITSFLLVAYKSKDEAARRGGLQALLITGGGGIALLAGLLLVAHVAGDASFSVILQSGAALRGSALYPAMVLLVAAGAFTKSAQAPAHIWLPRAMTAPTPASAFLHSATMVKAGVFLLARLNPALGGTELWFYLLTTVGLITMLTGAYLGLKQHDLKALLAYSTVSQLGVMVAMIGQGIEIAYKALVISVLAHALYKSALFMAAGIVDHETGTRDLRRLGGLRRALPATFAVAAVAGLSMAGLPPLFGFLAKETLLATTTHPGLPSWLNVVSAAMAVLAGALMLAQAGLLVWDTFLGRARAAGLHAHEAPVGMWLAPAIPAALSLLLGLAPEPQIVVQTLATAAAASYGDKVKVSLALWTGLNVPLLLSVVAVSLGVLIFVGRDRVRAALLRGGERWSWQRVYEGGLAGVDRLATWATRLQSGYLRRYMGIMLGTLLLLLLAAIAAGQMPVLALNRLLTLPRVDFASELALLRVLGLVMVVGTALATLVLKRDLAAIIALSALGLGMALLMALEPAPDVALVQVVVDILSTVILVLAITRLPRAERHRAQALTFAQSRGGLLRDGLIAGGLGAVVALVTLSLLVTRPRLSEVTPFYAANAKPLTGARDIVGAIVVDFRGFDTLIEITVFALAGLGVYTLLRYAAKTANDRVPNPPPAQARWLSTRGVGRYPTSAFIHVLAYAVLPLAMMIALTHIVYGHDQPGDGFTAGVIISLAVAFWYVVFGYEQTKRRLGWLKPRRLIAAGITLALVQALLSWAVNAVFFSPLDMGARWSLPLPTGFAFSASFLFEVAICLAVLGSASLMLDTLGHPADVEED